MKVGIASLGCKVNLYESEFIENKLKEAGYTIGSFSDLCDIYIINTCTVTNTADSKSRKIIRQAIKRNKDAVIVVLGCFIEANKDYYEDGIDIIIGNKDKSKIVEILDEYLLKKETLKRLYNEEYKEFEDMYISNFNERTRAFVKIQDGCENFCSYCIIPYVRGKCRSKKLDVVLKEINELVDNGYKEVVLTGIHTGNYGVDLNIKFSDLLKEIVKIEGLKRLRISSIEATELTDEVLDIIKNSNIIVDHLHIPIQSGSDKILKLMNRKYDLAYFKEKVEKIRKIRPNISITTDLIVGFPGEDDEDFLDTINTCKELKFTKIHVFPFSLRNGTKACELPNHVDSKVKKERCGRLLKVSKELELAYYNEFIGSEVEVLIEKQKDNNSYGHTSNYLYVKIPKKIEENTLYKTKITSVSYPYCIGE